MSKCVKHLLQLTEGVAEALSPQDADLTGTTVSSVLYGTTVAEIMHGTDDGATCTFSFSAVQHEGLHAARTFDEYRLHRPPRRLCVAAYCSLCTYRQVYIYSVPVLRTTQEMINRTDNMPQCKQDVCLSNTIEVRLLSTPSDEIYQGATHRVHAVPCLAMF